MILANDDWLELALMVSWRFQKLRQAFAEAVGTPSRTLMVYLDVVHNNLVGDTKHPLLREVVYKCDGTGSMYFEPLHMQWIPVRRPFLDVIEIEVAETNGKLVHFGPGKTVITYQFRLVSLKI